MQTPGSNVTQTISSSTVVRLAIGDTYTNGAQCLPSNICYINDLDLPDTTICHSPENDGCPGAPSAVNT